ncbi:SH3 beta-barrel fold-containing protein [Bacteroides sp.]|uniref:SH3 beta-barrel fold-containing protein n=1 Tax=Bacteroides sp. TaxID=29523 RepID=UPI0023CA36ED|nr:SH3 beta-barrel fold-containing protein [Bacteroides sp.]MDE6217243.1 SH3 beta-barrel fold-containing protein [Bacteroides sp.]
MGKEKTGIEEQFVSKTEKAKRRWEKRIMENTSLGTESAQWMAQRIGSLLEYMRYGYALIAYRKQDGSFYMGKGTLIPYENDFKKKHDVAGVKAHVAYWDVERQGWRTFLVENFMEWRPIVN